MGTKTFAFSSKNQDFLPDNDQIWPKIGIFGQFGPCRLIRCPVGGSVGGCGTRAVSRKTPIHFIIYTMSMETIGVGRIFLRIASSNYDVYTLSKYQTAYVQKSLGK